MKKPHWIMREHLCDPVEYICSVCGEKVKIIRDCSN